MENSPIRSPQKPAAANPVARHAGVRQAPGNEAASPGGKVDFSQLLADAAGPSLMASPGEEVDSQVGAAVEWSGLTPQAMAEAGMFSLASLVGQTARMDSAADAAQRDGRAPVSEDGATGPAALPMGAGQSAVAASLPAASAQAGVDTHTNADVSLADAALVPETAVPPQAQSTAALAQAGAERAAPPPGLAALLAQMEAVPAAAAPGLAAAAAPAAANAAVGTGTSPVGTVGLSDTAAQGPAEVPEQVVPTDAALAQPDEALADSLSEQVAFWVQQKTQRAEMTIDRHGQPVKVQVVVTGNEAHVTFRSNEQQTRDMLDASTAQLRELLEQQGLTLAGVTVQTADAGRQGAGDASAGRDSAGRSPAQREEGDGRQITMVSADLRARPDASRAVDLFV